MGEMKSLAMKNFIFKSNYQSDLDKMFSLLRVMAGEQRAQRGDLAHIKRQLNKFLPEFIEVPPEEENGNSGSS